MSRFPGTRAKGAIGNPSASKAQEQSKVLVEDAKPSRALPFRILAVVIETEEARGSPRKEEKSKVLFRTCPNQMDCLYEGRDHENGGARYPITWKLGTPWSGRSQAAHSEPSRKACKTSPSSATGWDYDRAPQRALSNLLVSWPIDTALTQPQQRVAEQSQDLGPHIAYYHRWAA